MVSFSGDNCDLYNTDAASFLAAQPDKSIDLILTDPPFGVGDQRVHRGEFRMDKVAGDLLPPQIDWLLEGYRALKDEGAIYCFCKWTNVDVWKPLLRVAGFVVKNIIIWDKGVHTVGDLYGQYAPRYEMILFAAKGASTHALRGNRIDDIIMVPRITVTNDIKRVHSYQKPFALLDILIEKSTDPDMLVVDPFMGSGSCAISAAIRTGRRFAGSELSPDVFATAVDFVFNTDHQVPMFGTNIDLIQQSITQLDFSGTEAIL